MRLKKRLILANAATVIIPMLVTVLVALASFFIFDSLLGNDNSFDNYQRQSLIRVELLKETNALSKAPEMIKNEQFLEYLQVKLAEVQGEYLYLKDDQVINSSKNFSKIDVAKCLEAGKTTARREPVKVNDLSYIVQMTELKFQDGSQGYFLLLEPADTPGSRVTSYIWVVGVAFVLTFVLINILVSYQFSRSVLKPLLFLQKAAAEITRGNLDYPIAEEGDQEIQALCRDLELLRIKLKESVHTQLKYEDNRKMLISSISHDLKTPVTSIKGYVEGILDGIASHPDKLERYLKTIALKAYQVDQMIDDLLLYAKLDLNQIPYNFERMEIDDFLQQCILESEPELEQSNIRISLTNELEQKHYVLLDRERMKRVIMNIFDNSRKYLNKDQGVINVFLRETFASVIIELRDNGSGINEDDLPRIFDRFYRSDAARSKGSGLGLAIAKQIIEGHNGRIWAVSHEKEWTSIMISLSKS